MRTLLLAVALAASITALPFVVATSDCGGVSSGGARAQTCRGEYHTNGCDAYSCSSDDAAEYAAFVQYDSAGGFAGASASEGHDDYCSSDASQYACSSNEGAGAGAFVSTFVPFVGPVNGGSSLATYSYQTHGSSGDQCVWWVFVGSSSVPISSDCGVTMPALP